MRGAGNVADANREARLRREIWELCCAATQDGLPLEAIYGALAVRW